MNERQLLEKCKRSEGRTVARNAIFRSLDMPFDGLQKTFAAHVRASADTNVSRLRRKGLCTVLAGILLYIFHTYYLEEHFRNANRPNSQQITVTSSEDVHQTPKKLCTYLHSDEDALGKDTWLSRCRHHLCTPHQQPAWYYLCDPSKREWGLSFVVGGHWPDDDGPRVERSETIVGHEGWAGSVIRGLTELGPDAGFWNYNPSHNDMLSDVIWTDDCARARAAVSSGSASHAKFIICGAVGNTFSLHEDLHDARVGFFIAPSPWVADQFRGQSIPIRVLVSGVDPHFFSPSHNHSEKVLRLFSDQPNKVVVLYLKHEGEYQFGRNDSIVQQVGSTLVAEGWEVLPLVYGSYDRYMWKDKLNRAVAAIFITSTESQSIALAEAWSMDVPTFVYEVSRLHPLFVFERWWTHANEGPYINYMNGARWSTVEGLINLLNHMQEQSWTPREYVLNTMTDEIATWNVLRAIECEWKKRFDISLKG